MPHLTLRRAPLALAILAFASTSAYADDTALKAEVDALKAEVDALKAEVRDMRQARAVPVGSAAVMTSPGAPEPMTATPAPLPAGRCAPAASTATRLRYWVFLSHFWCLARSRSAPPWAR